MLEQGYAQNIMEIQQKEYMQWYASRSWEGHRTQDTQGKWIWQVNGEQLGLGWLRIWDVAEAGEQ